MPPRDDHAVTDVGARISVRRWQVERDDLGVFPKEASGKVDLSPDLPTHEALFAHVGILRSSSGDIPGRWRMQPAHAQCASLGSASLEPPLKS